MRRALPVLCLATVLPACPAADPGPTLPAGSTCNGDVCVVTGPILADATFTADKKWVLQGGVFVGDDTDPTRAPTTLTIEPGTTVFGDTSALSFLLVTRGSRLLAAGTAERPIVFTSANDPGSRSRGDWGGVILNGQATVNGCAGDPCTLQGEAGTGTYGGGNDDDDSGVLEFVRIEFPGKLIDAENELNGLALQGVGRGTTLENIQVHLAADDCIEFFGGTVDAKRIVCTGAGDDNVDWTFGWRGRAQFVVVQQHADAGERGIEADNNEDNHTLTPTSSPTLSNLTLIGGGDPSGDVGIKLRRGTEAHIMNSVVAGWKKACLDLDDQATFDHATAGDIVIENSVFACDTLAIVKDGTDGTPADPIDVATFLRDAAGNEVATDVGLVDAFNVLAPKFAPTSSSPANSLPTLPSDSFFEAVSFKGAVGENDWTAGWTAFPAN